MDFWRFVWKRKWLVVIPVVLFTTATSLVAYSRPVIYRSETRIMVVPQRVPESFVPSSISTKLEDRLQAIKQQILSRTRLERIITEFNLYEVERKTNIMEDLVQRMRTRDIGIGTVQIRDDSDAVAFTVSFQSVDPRTAMRVTEKLASLFINENLSDRQRMAQNTVMFLESQIEALAREVDEFAARMEQDRIEHRTSPRSQVSSTKNGRTLTVRCSPIASRRVSRPTWRRDRSASSSRSSIRHEFRLARKDPSACASA